MPSTLSLHTSWLPRTVLVQHVICRSAASNADTPLAHRSASRFSLKIARFLFSKERLKQSARYSTHPHYTKSETHGDIHEVARAFVLSLEPDHRRILSDQLTQVDKLSETTNGTVPILRSQLAVGRKHSEGSSE